MASPKIIIADNDINYIAPIQLKFIEEFFDKIQLEVITDKNYYDEYFSHPRNVDILIVSEDYYDSSVKKHNIAHVFVMTEELEEENTAELTVNASLIFSRGSTWICPKFCVNSKSRCKIEQKLLFRGESPLLTV